MNLSINIHNFLWLWVDFVFAAQFAIWRTFETALLTLIVSKSNY